ncbi:DMT family transporter [Thalassobaculum sp. OXR-137]|uniref:DMT family transporter n=1 Tax=Thalassobaculum sp. OXR-137 TaxID=3100173 RepID=UPI002AC914D5|nr:DMT family transporter [Thalassobaculum sp. OXR-137]WPZ34739.1 DMT family transporter [Thalassobaculum sp. OXR-137]
MSEALPKKAANAYLLLVLTTLSWGANAVAAKMSVGELSPMLLTLLRWLGVVILLAIFARGRVAAEWPVLRRHWLKIFLMGALGFCVFNTLMYVAAKHTQAVNIGILQGAIPIFVLLGAFAAYRTPVRGVQILGVAITMIGVALVASKGDFGRLAALELNFGDVLIVVACVLYAGYTVSLRKRPPLSGMTMFAGLATAAFLTSIPGAGYEYLVGDLQAPTAKGWGIVAFVVIFPSFLAQISFLLAVDQVGPGRAGVFVNLVPIFAAVLSVAILNEAFHLYHALALVLVLGGIAIAERFKR